MTSSTSTSYVAKKANALATIYDIKAVPGDTHIASFRWNGKDWVLIAPNDPELKQLWPKVWDNSGLDKKAILKRYLIALREILDS